MDLAHQHGQGRAVREQPVGQQRRVGREPGSEGVQERPRRAGDRLGHQFLHVGAGDLATRSIERQLLQLAVRHLRLPSAIDIPFTHEGAHALRECLRGSRSQSHAQLPGAFDEPQGHPVTSERGHLAHQAAGRLDRVAQHPRTGRPAGILADESPRSTDRSPARPLPATPWCVPVPSSHGGDRRVGEPPRACRRRTSSTSRAGPRSHRGAGSVACCCRHPTHPVHRRGQHARSRAERSRRLPRPGSARARPGRCPRRPHPRCRPPVSRTPFPGRPIRRLPFGRVLLGGSERRGCP